VILLRISAASFTSLALAQAKVSASLQKRRSTPESFFKKLSHTHIRKPDGGQDIILFSNFVGFNTSYFCTRYPSIQRNLEFLPLRKDLKFDNHAM